MINLKKIGKVMSRKQSDQNEYFYSRETNEIIKKDPIFITKALTGFPNNEYDKLSPKDKLFVENLLDMILNDSKKIIPIPNIPKEVEFTIMKDFCEYMKEEDMKVSKTLRKEIGGKGTFARFASKIKELGYERPFKEFKEGVVEDLAYDWAVDEGVIEPQYCLKAYEELFQSMKDVFDMQLWKLFKDDNLIHIKYGNEDYYFNIFGWENNKGGIEILIGDKGLEAHSLIFDDDTNISTNLLISLQDSYRLQYNDEENLSDEDLDLLKEIDMTFENDLYPQIQKLKRGFYPTNKLADSEAEELKDALDALICAVDAYLDKPIYVDFKEYELYINLDKKTPFISKRRVLIPDYLGIKKCPLNEEKIQVIDQCVEFHIDCLSTIIEPQMSFSNLWGYVLVGLDDETKHLYFHKLDTYDEHDALVNMRNDVIKVFIDRGYPKTIKCTDFVTYVMFEFLSEFGIEVIPAEPSDEMINLFDEFDGVALNSDDEYIH